MSAPRGSVVVVTGLSGAGKSTALHALEDLGYFCVDNLPTALVEQALHVCDAGGIRRVAFGIDVRVGSFLDGATEALARIAEGERELVVLFLEASDEEIVRRFNETRRPHPLSASASVRPPAPGGEGRSSLASAVLDGVRLERERLAPLRAIATVVIDTSSKSVHDLRRQVLGTIGKTEEQPRMVTRFVSFGFKYGIPIDADVVFDVRFLPNPHFVPELRALPGTDPAIQDFVLSRVDTREFLNKTEDWLRYCLPRYQQEGKSYLTVAVGCTGGRHRSVVLAAHLAEVLARNTRLPITVVHRDVARTHNL
jgi:UPF0042 nucleotide-binding protein